MNTPRDPDFDRLLDDAEDLVARYRALPAVEPPRELDVAILARAREAVARPKPNRWRWLVPVASAATVALAAGIGWKVFHAEQRAAVRETAAGESAREEQIVEFELLDLPNRDAERKEMANSPPMPAEPAKPSAPAPAVAAPPPAAATAAVPEPFSADAAPTDNAEVRLQESAAKREKATAAQPFMEPHLRADHAGLSQPPEADRRQAEVSASQARQRQLGAAGADAAANELSRESAKSNAGEILEPEEWIGKIRDLQVRRRFSEVRKELAAFRATYPNYPLPDDLAKLGR